MFIFTPYDKYSISWKLIVNGKSRRFIKYNTETQDTFETTKARRQYTKILNGEWMSDMHHKGRWSRMKNVNSFIYRRLLLLSTIGTYVAHCIHNIIQWKLVLKPTRNRWMLIFNVSLLLFNWFYNNIVIRFYIINKLFETKALGTIWTNTEKRYN